ncbi:beta-mannosidase [Chitinophaga sp. YR627]|uniref:beta-mannosidase n=1 Tax=Chitinophaga sp. YR627 TaxID=1881041 RepID=UPI0008F0240C|nr:glycoside hydrolase family 2 protein [Chitinophaga sp. YR627]SFO19392.1 beta-mannosidase [Chitinophaga sp. YR627]
MKNKLHYTLLLCLCMLARMAHAQTTVTLSLNGEWEFADADDSVWRKATVPGTVHTDLLAHHLIPDPFVGMNEKAVQWVDKKDWIYRKSFEVAAALLAHDVIGLQLPELDTYADVYINDHLVLQSHNMFVGHEVNVKQWLHSGQNQLRIFFHSPVRYDMERFLKDSLIYPAGNDASDIPLSVYARKAPYHYGWDWGPRLVTSGISGGASLTAWNKTNISDVWLQQQGLTDKAATVRAAITLETVQAGKYTMQIESPDKLFTTVTVEKGLNAGLQTLELPFSIQRPKRWWPNGLGDPFLYKVKVSILDGKQLIAARMLNIGLRTVEVINAPDSLGESFYVKVNGQPVFMKGANYIPQDNFRPRITDERYQQLFKDMKESHFNMVRVWGGGAYEKDLFYELADQQGILVWQDFMFACTVYPSDTAFLANVKEELRYNITRLRNHASLALWCGNNEVAVAIKNWGWQSGYGYTDAQWKTLQQGYDILFKSLLPEQVKTMDPGRFYFHSSPISNWGSKQDFTKGDNHYWGVWHGMEWFEAFNTHVPRFMSEYGFQSFPDMHTIRRFAGKNDQDIYSPVMLSHQKSTNRGNAAINTYLQHYYKTPKDFASLIYVNQVLQAEGMRIAIEAHRRAMPYCMGTLYWQLNDCWPGPSWSGIDYYGRWKSLQYFVKKAFAPVIVSHVEAQDKLQTWVVSDVPQEQPLTLEMQLMDLEGKVLWERSITNIQPKAAKSQLLYEVPVSELLKGFDAQKVIFYSKVVKKDELLTRNVYYFAKASTMELPDPGIQTSVTTGADGTIAVKITAGKLARNVYLLLENDPKSQFSDNYFDLLPGETATVRVNSELTLQQVKEQLKVISLRDTFKN